MSDFSCGIMMGNNHKDVAVNYLEPDTVLIRLSNEWLCRLSESDSREMVVENYSQAVLDMSVKIPLLHIRHHEDHGFELGILHNKKIAFYFYVEYAIESNFSFNVGTELYGDDFAILMTKPDVKERVNSEVRSRYHEVDEKIERCFASINDINIKQFKLFGFDDEWCAKARNLLTASNYKKDGTFTCQINDLLAMLGLENFSFVSHRYVCLGDDNFEVVERG